MWPTLSPGLDTSVRAVEGGCQSSTRSPLPHQIRLASSPRVNAGIGGPSRSARCGTWKFGEKKKPLKPDLTLLLLFPSPMRVLINYATYADRVTIHCLAENARTVVAPFKRVSSLETLYRLIRHVGGDAGQCREEIHKWGHGGCWANVKPEHFALLGIKKTPHSEQDGNPGRRTSF